MISREVHVDIPGHPYPIYIGENLLNNAHLFKKHILGQQVMVITNKSIGALFLATLKKSLGLYQCDAVFLPEGEAYKTLASWEMILNKLVEAKYHRDSTLIALGGGVIGDITGFAAATYQRGINFIQIPTTLLAQVDSSVGGKTAVNHPGGKNLIGAFYQPNAVLIELATLTTLPTRELKAGLAEIVKTALIQDAGFFQWLEQHSHDILNQNKEALLHAIATCCQIKATIVAKDETEKSIRSFLNLGHTFGHAIEMILGYGTWLHGEAVAAGLCLAAKLSHLKGTLSKHDVGRIIHLIGSLGLPTELPDAISLDALLLAMTMDKKVEQRQMRFILLNKIGEAFISNTVTNDELSSVYSQK